MDFTNSLESSQKDNYSRIFNLIYHKGKISKQEIALELKLSLPTVSQNLKLLCKNGLIYTAGKFESQIGRRAVAYAACVHKYIALGLEMFKHHLTIIALDLRGTEMATEILHLHYSNSEQYFKEVCSWVTSFIKKHDFEKKHILGLGVGIQGLVSYDNQAILYGKILGCTGLTTEAFTKYLAYPVRFYHDADCVAVAEHFLTNSHQDTIYLSIGEHLGTAIMINDSIYTGENGRSGTMEHITLNTQSNRKCYCGRYGCIETYCSMSSLLNSGETIEDFMAKLHKGKAEIKKRWDQYLNYLAEAINNLHMFSNNRLIIAGELAQYLDDSVVNQLGQIIKKITAFPEDHSYLSLGVVAPHSVAIGAAIPSIDNFIHAI
ncbi:MAG: ROK family transcriptional regulator [Sporolactobacillus sp.]|nr:ROK family transcriptional regulator [Sporolactobacillus sp.]